MGRHPNNATRQPEGLIAMSITQRIDAITEIASAYRTTQPPAPRSVKIELTGKCNFKCSFCAHNQRLRSIFDDHDAGHEG